MANSITEMKELRGVEFTDEGGEECFVAFADREVGFTTKWMESGQDAYCINRKQFSQDTTYHGLRLGEINRLWHELFDYMLQGILDGSGRVSCHVSYIKRRVYPGRAGLGGSRSFTCAF